MLKRYEETSAIMARSQTIAGLVGLLCVVFAVVTLPSFVMKVLLPLLDPAICDVWGIFAGGSTHI